MTIIRRSAGLIGVVLSMLGLLLCVAGAVGVWVGKNRVDGVAAAMFTAADDAFEFISTRLVRVDERLASTRERVADFSARARLLQTLEAGDEATVAGKWDAEVESLRGLLDMIASELRAAETWLDSIAVVARGVHSAAESIAQSQAAAARPASAATDGMDDRSTGVTAAKVAELSGNLAEAVNRLQVLREKLIEMHENRTLARGFAAAIIAEAAELDTRLNNLSAKISDCGERVSQARASSNEAGLRTHRWITLTAVAITLALLWFGVSQVCVLKRAWRMWRKLFPLRG